MKTVVFHLGTYKTGSSAIQNAAYESRSVLLKKGWLYPDAGMIKHEQKIGYRHSKYFWDYVENRLRWNQHVEALIAEIRSSECDKILLSSEAWSRPVAWPSLIELIQAVRTAGIKLANGIVFFRNQQGYAKSLYREFTRRHRNKLLFVDFVKENADAFDISRVASELHTIFEGNLVCLPFNGSDDIVETFFRELGAPFLKSSKPRKLNQSLNSVEIEIKRLLNEKRAFLSEAYPGLEKLFGELGIEFDPSNYTEVIPDGLLVNDAQSRSAFQQITKWSDRLVDTMFETPQESLIDVSLLTPHIELMLEDWTIPLPLEGVEQGKRQSRESLGKRLRRLYWLLMRYLE